MKLENIKDATYLIEKLNLLQQQKKEIERYSHPYRFNVTFYGNMRDNASITVEDAGLAEGFKIALVDHIESEISTIKKQIIKL